MTVHRVDHDEPSNPPAAVVPGEVITDEPTQGEEEAADEAQAEGAVAEVAPAEEAPAEVGPAEVGPAEVGPAEGTAAEVAPAVVTVAEVAPAEVAQAAAPVATLVPVASAKARDRDTEWSAIKAAFVDDPAASVGLAAAKVQKAIEDLATMLRRQQDSLLSALREESSATVTEQLRLAMQGYLAFYAELERLSDVTPLAESERRMTTALAATP